MCCIHWLLWFLVTLRDNQCETTVTANDHTANTWCVCLLLTALSRLHCQPSQTTSESGCRYVCLFVCAHVSGLLACFYTNIDFLVHQSLVGPKVCPNETEPHFWDLKLNVIVWLTCTFQLVLTRTHIKKKLYQEIPSFKSFYFLKKSLFKFCYS